jgi:hypothetical protein
MIGDTDTLHTYGQRERCIPLMRGCAAGVCTISHPE